MKKKTQFVETQPAFGADVQNKAVAPEQEKKADKKKADKKVEEPVVEQPAPEAAVSEPVADTAEVTEPADKDDK